MVRFNVAQCARVVTVMDEKPLFERKNLDAAFHFSLNDIPLKVFEMHWHKSIEVIYVINGTMNAHIEGQTWTVAQRDILVINSDAIHGFSNVFGSDTRMVVFQFGLALFDNLLVDIRDVATGGLVFASQPFISFTGDAAVHRRVEKCLLDMCTEHDAQHTGFSPSRYRAEYSADHTQNNAIFKEYKE